MARYVVGDVQGCHAELCALLERCRFDPASDRLWLVGDLVNRGPDSLRTLRLVRDLGQAAVAVLGNHDLYLLKVASSAAAKRKRHDTLQQVLDALDCAELMAWLRTCPLMHVEDGYAMVHAGLLPGWTVARARALAREVETVLAGPHYVDFLERLWGNQPDAWRDDLHGDARLRVIVNAMTRMRFCSLDGHMEFDAKGAPETAPPDHLPWYAHPGRRSADTVVLFGHWSALGLRMEERFIALDTGCVWGDRLTAVRLEDRMVFQVPAGKMHPFA